MSSAVILSAAAASLARPFPLEVGALRQDGRAWIRSDGSTFNARGVSMFLLLARFMAGKDIDPERRWMIAIGANYARIFPDWTLDQQDNALDDPATYRVLRDDLLPLLEGDGIRCSVVPITQDGSLDRHRRILQGAYDAVSPFHLVEGANEPWNAGWDMAARYNGIDRHSILSASGYPGAPGPVFERVTWRSGRDLQHYFRNGKDAIDLYGYDAFVHDDEPLGIADYSKDAPAARSNSRWDHLDHVATQRLFGGGTIHSQCGLEGRAPGHDIPDGHPEYGDESVTAAIVDGISQVWQAIPDAVYTGSYSRNGQSTFPLAIVGDEVKDGEGHGYASINGSTAYLHVPGALRRWSTDDLINGWTTLTPIGPSDIALYRVTR